MTYGNFSLLRAPFLAFRLGSAIEGSVVGCPIRCPLFISVRLFPSGDLSNVLFDQHQRPVSVFFAHGRDREPLVMWARLESNLDFRRGEEV
jgi:hypothetical protein